MDVGGFPANISQLGAATTTLVPTGAFPAKAGIFKTPAFAGETQSKRGNYGEKSNRFY